MGEVAHLDHGVGGEFEESQFLLERGGVGFGESRLFCLCDLLQQLVTVLYHQVICCVCLGGEGDTSEQCEEGMCGV